MIAIIDYDMGNLRSVSKAFEAVGHQAVVTRDARVIGNASHVVLPGVGAFGDCMANIEQYGLVEPIRASIQSGKPFLGIRSEERRVGKECRSRGCGEEYKKKKGSA